MLKGSYLIAGSTGLMGTATLIRLQNIPGVEVRATYHSRPPIIIAKNISYVKADLMSLSDCKKIVEGIDYVFMFAAKLSTAPVVSKNPISHITSNMTMNMQILEASYFAQIKKFIWLSSATGYPEDEEILSEEKMFKGDPPRNHFPVGWMSRYTEVLCRMYATKLKNPITSVVLRPTTIYGEWENFDFETSHMLPALIRKVVEKHNPIEIWGNGENSRDLIYADDVVDACLMALKNIEGFDVFNIGLGKEYTVNQLLRMIIDIVGVSSVQIVNDLSKPNSFIRKTIPLTKAEKALGFHAKTPIKVGLTKVISWYRDQREKETVNAQGSQDY